MSRFASATWRPFHSSLEHTKRFSAATVPTRALRFNVHSSYSPQRTLSISHDRQDLPVSGLEDEFVGYVFGKKKATDVAHSVWKHVVRKGDTVIDATCGNGHDTLALLRLVADKSARGLVYGMDIQEDALYSTHYLLGQSFSSEELDHVELFPLCHSKMEEIIPKGSSVRLVAFNLGYLPGGDKAITTRSATTLLALEAAGRIVEPGGLISTVVYVGHPGGREEFETVQAFAAGLSTENWVCCKLEMLNRPLAPIPIFMFKR